MSINAINSVSLYEYYYTINRKEEKKESPLADEMRKYGLTPTDNEALNVSLLKKAKEQEEAKNSEEKSSSYSDRPWADIMYQLDISFNKDPKDDIQDIKDEIRELTYGLKDEELTKDLEDLESYVENLYINYQSNNSGGFDYSNTLTSQLNNLSRINQASLL